MEALMSFPQFRSEFMRLYHLGDYDNALTWLRLGGGQYPDRAALLFFWRACILSLLSQPQEAIQTLQDGIDLGYWWSENLLRSDIDLISLQGRSEFEALVLISEERHWKAEFDNPVEVMVFPPLIDEITPSPLPIPLMLLLHSKQGNPMDMSQPFLKLTEQGWMIANVKSSQMSFPGGYTWDDRERARKDVTTMLEEIMKKYPIDPSRLVISGFSQGGGLALELSLSGVVPAQGVIAIAPYTREVEKIIPSVSLSPVKKPRVFLITGDEDSGQSIFTHIKENLINYQVPHQWERHTSLGHDFPPDFYSSLEKGLDFIFKK